MITCITFDDISPNYLSKSKLENIVNFFNKLNIPSTMFVIPYQYNEYNSIEFIDVLKDAQAYGHEISLHGYKHIGNPFVSEFGSFLPFNLPSLRVQKERIKIGLKELFNITGVKSKGFRAPFYLHNISTLKSLSELKFSYDSSKTIFKPACIHPMRIRIMKNIKPFKIQNILELPVTGDYTYNIINSNLMICVEHALKDFNFTKLHDGIFILNNHLTNKNINLMLRFFNELIKKIIDNTSFLKLCDIQKINKYKPENKI